MAGIDLDSLLAYITEDNIRQIKTIRAEHIKKIENDCCLKYDNIPTDIIAQELLPDDIPLEEGYGIRPLKTCTDGNCLFNALSLVLKGETINCLID
jgi:hypothetical protein